MSPYKAFHNYVVDKKKVSGPWKLLLHYLRVYGCKAYTLIKSKNDPQYFCKCHKLDAKAHISFFVSYKLTNIYRVWIPHKKNVISVWDVIFDKNKVWDSKPIISIFDKIRELDKAIEIVEVPPSEEIENIYFQEDIDIELELTITRQTNYKAENLDTDDINTKNIANKLAKDKDKKWVQNQYPTLDFLVLNAVLANSVSMPVINLAPNEHQINICDSIDSCKSEGVELARLDQLDKQQKFRFNEFLLLRVHTKLQTAFVAGIKVHKQDLPLEPVNYQKLKDHLFEEYFCVDMEIHMQQHR